VSITAEVNIDKGIGYHLVGLPDNAIKESIFRIAAALQNNGYKIPGKKLSLIWFLPIFEKKVLPMTLYEFNVLNDDDQLTFFKSLRETSYYQYDTFISKLS